MPRLQPPLDLSRSRPWTRWLPAGVFAVLLAVPTLPAGWTAPLRLGGACVLRSGLGVACPGCGLTRAVHAASRGQWSDSLDLHPLGPLTLAWVCAGLWLHARSALRREVSTATPRMHAAYGVLLLGVWVLGAGWTR